MGRTARVSRMEAPVAAAVPRTAWEPPVDGPKADGLKQAFQRVKDRSIHSLVLLQGESLENFIVAEVKSPAFLKLLRFILTIITFGLFCIMRCLLDKVQEQTYQFIVVTNKRYMCWRESAGAVHSRRPRRWAQRSFPIAALAASHYYIDQNPMGCGFFKEDSICIKLFPGIYPEMQTGIDGVSYPVRKPFAPRPLVSLKEFIEEHTNGDLSFFEAITTGPMNALGFLARQFLKVAKFMLIPFRFVFGVIQSCLFFINHVWDVCPEEGLVSLDLTIQDPSELNCSNWDTVYETVMEFVRTVNKARKPRVSCNTRDWEKNLNGEIKGGCFADDLRMGWVKGFADQSVANIKPVSLGVNEGEMFQSGANVSVYVGFSDWLLAFFTAGIWYCLSIRKKVKSTSCLYATTQRFIIADCVGGDSGAMYNDSKKYKLSVTSLFDPSAQHGFLDIDTRPNCCWYLFHRNDVHFGLVSKIGAIMFTRSGVSDGRREQLFTLMSSCVSLVPSGTDSSRIVTAASIQEEGMQVPAGTEAGNMAPELSGIVPVGTELVGRIQHGRSDGGFFGSSVLRKYLSFTSTHIFSVSTTHTSQVESSQPVSESVVFMSLDAISNATCKAVENMYGPCCFCLSDHDIAPRAELMPGLYFAFADVNGDSLINTMFNTRVGGCASRILTGELTWDSPDIKRMVLLLGYLVGPSTPQAEVRGV